MRLWVGLFRVLIVPAFLCAECHAMQIPEYHEGGLQSRSPNCLQEETDLNLTAKGAWCRGKQRNRHWVFAGKVQIGASRK